MNLVIDPMSEPIVFSNGDVQTLYIQGPHKYRCMIESLHDEYYKRDESTNTVRLLNDRRELLDITKHTLLIHDSYTFDISSRQIITALIKDLQEKSVFDDAILQKIEKDIIGLIGELDLQSRHKLDYKADVGLHDLLKMMEVKLAASEQHSFLDKIYSIIEIAGDLLSKRLVIFINQRCLLNPEEFVGLMEFANHQQQAVLFIDPVNVVAADGEQRTVVDDDLYCYKQQF